MIVSLAIRTGCLPDEWDRQDPADVVTALEILERLDQQARREQQQR